MIENFLKLSKKKDGRRKYWLHLNQIVNWLQIQIKIVCIKVKTLFTAIPEVDNGKVYLHLGSSLSTIQLFNAFAFVS